jgi:hypothetical protein
MTDSFEPALPQKAPSINTLCHVMATVPSVRL